MLWRVAKIILGPLVRWLLRRVFAWSAWLGYSVSGYDAAAAAATALTPKPASGKRFCIFALHQKNALEANLAEAIARLGQKGFNVLVVNSGRIGQEIIPCWHYVERQNQGRDFGSYQFGALLLRTYLNGETPEQVLFCNDSVFYLPDRFSDFIDQVLSRTDDWIGVTEAQMPRPHVQSWLFAVSGKLWAARAFEDYWRSYLPLNARQHAIWQGEIGLSKILQKAEFKPTVAYPSGGFLVPLRTNKDTLDFEKLKQLFPQPFISLPNLNAANWYPRLVLFQQGASPIHLWQILGVERSNLPFIKKDLFYRAVFSERQLHAFLPDKKMEATILARTPPRRLLRRFLWRQGII